MINAALRVFCFCILALNLANCSGSAPAALANYPKPPDRAQAAEDSSFIESPEVARKGDCAQECEFGTSFETNGMEVEIIETYQNGRLPHNRQTDFAINGETGFAADPRTQLFSVAPVVVADSSEEDVLVSSRYFFSGGVFVYEDLPYYYVGSLDYLDYVSDPKQLQHFGVVLAHTDETTWEYENVKWFYVRTTDNGAIAVHGEDGSITYHDAQWSAQFNEGDLSLEGTLDGIYVVGDFEGEISGERFEGDFIGLDGKLQDEAQTAGVFGGLNETQTSSLAGGWFNTDFYLETN